MKANEEIMEILEDSISDPEQRKPRLHLRAATLRQ